MQVGSGEEPGLVDPPAGALNERIVDTLDTSVCQHIDQDLFHATVTVSSHTACQSGADQIQA